jgi:hypothetical protein
LDKLGPRLRHDHLHGNRTALALDVMLEEGTNDVPLISGERVRKCMEITLWRAPRRAVHYTKRYTLLAMAQCVTPAMGELGHGGHFTVAVYHKLKEQPITEVDSVWWRPGGRTCTHTCVAGGHPWVCLAPTVTAC